MTQTELRDRTKAFALQTIRLVEVIPATRTGIAVTSQLARSGTSVGASHRSAYKAKSNRDFLNKMIIIEEEAGESAHWRELLQEGGLMAAEAVGPIRKEAKELTDIFTASGRTVRSRLSRPGTGGRYVRETEFSYNPELEIRDPESDPPQ